MSDPTYITKEQLQNVVSHLQARIESLQAELAASRVELEKQSMFQDARGWVLWQMLDRIATRGAIPSLDDFRKESRELAQEYEKLQLEEVKRSTKAPTTQNPSFEIEHG